MSWDVYIVDGENEVDDVRNVTYNNSKIFQAIGCYYKDLDGSCLMWAELAKQGISELKNNPEKYRHLEPENKWGGIDDCIDFLTKLLSKCLQHPRLRVEWR